jgi:Cu(I)/Ag(I) efflux system protein CusF
VKEKDMKRLLLASLVVATLTVPVLTGAAEHGLHDSATDAANLTAGEVRKIDRAQGKVTLAHEPIESHGMPKMTMVFRVADPAMLDQVKPGDKVRFAADKRDGNYTVTRWEIAP